MEASDRSRDYAAPPKPAPDICVILNAKSGKQQAERERALAEACERFPGRFAIRKVSRGDDLERTIRDAMAEGFPTLVAAGGDGTIAAVAGCLAGTEHRMGVLPLGTFNYFARSLGLPDDFDEAIRVIAEGQPRDIDVGDVNGRVFLNNASLGAYPQILEHRERIYRRWGRSRLVAYVSLFVTLLRFRQPLRMRLTVDGTSRQVRTPLLFVAKNAGQLEEVGLEGADHIRSGRFAVFVAPDTNRFGLLIFAIRLALGLSEPREDFELIAGQEVVAETLRRRRLVARDGERELMASPFRFRLHPRALTILVPPEAA